MHQYETRVRIDPGGSVVKNPPANAGDAGSIPGSGRSPGEGNDNRFQYSCLENLMDKGTWWVESKGSDTAEHLSMREGHILLS